MTEKATRWTGGCGSQWIDYLLTAAATPGKKSFKKR